MTASFARLTRAAAIAAVAFATLAAAPAGADPRVGVTAPDFTARDSNGLSHTLSQYRGKTVILEWTNHECPYVGKHYGTGNMQALQKDTTKDGIVWLSVISSAPGRQGYVEASEANALTEKRDAAPSAVLLDPEGAVGRLYGARTTPHMYIVDTSGTLVYKGAIDDIPSARHSDVEKARNHVRVALKQMAEGQAIDQSATRPYGCSVKYGS